MAPPARIYDFDAGTMVAVKGDVEKVRAGAAGRRGSDPGELELQRPGGDCRVEGGDGPRPEAAHRAGLQDYPAAGFGGVPYPTGGARPKAVRESDQSRPFSRAQDYAYTRTAPPRPTRTTPRRSANCWPGISSSRCCSGMRSRIFTVGRLHLCRVWSQERPDQPGGQYPGWQAAPGGGPQCQCEERQRPPAARSGHGAARGRTVAPEL